MREVHWNYLAKSDYFQNIDYLLEKWSEAEAQEFIDEVYEVEKALKQGNVDFRDTDYPNIKCYVLRKQITLFYKVLDSDNVELLRFWNNYQDNNKLRL